MKRTLLTTAFILLGSTAAAFARGHTTVIALDQSCDKFDVTVTKNTAVALDAPSCSAMFGGGVIAKKDGFVVLGLQDPSQPGVQYILELSYPFVDGGPYTLYETTDGLRLQDAQDGTYSVETDRTGATQHLPSITSLVHR